jgi:hypothetical protein
MFHQESPAISEGSISPLAPLASKFHILSILKAQNRLEISETVVLISITILYDQSWEQLIPSEGMIAPPTNDAADVM